MIRSRYRLRRDVLRLARIAIFTVLLFQTEPSAFADNWTFLYQADGIKVFSNEAALPAFRAEGVLALDVVDILTVFADVSRRTEWVRNLGESRVVHDNHVNRVVVYSRYDLPWPASDRDSLIETTYTNDYKGGEAMIRFKAIEGTDERPRKNVIRIPTADGFLQLKVLGENRTFVRYEVQLDPGGWLPQWICNFFVRDAPMDMLRAMQRRIAEKKDLNRDFRETQRKLWHSDREK